MENKPTAPWLIALITSLGFIVFNLVLLATDQLTNNYMSWVSSAILVIVIIWACIHYAKQMNGDVTFGNVFGHGFKVTAGIAAIMSVYTFIAFKFIHPEVIEKTIDIARAEMEKKPELNAEAIDMGLNMTRKFFIPFALAGSLFGTAFVGLIASLLGAAFAKKNPPKSPFETVS
ncbi:MAG: DUF4199 domain-containing protein [Bacteroidota bacterium]